MSEREIRTIIQRVREELDRQAKRIIYPSLIGAGLALTGCSDSASLYAVPMYGVPPRDGAVDHILPPAEAAYGLPDRVRAEAVVPRPDMAGVPDRGRDLKKIDSGGTILYMAPDVGPKTDAAKKADTGGTKLDAGGVMLYSVPNPDGAVTKKDVGGTKLDAGGVMLYSVPTPDAK